MSIRARIKDDWGTFTHYARKRGISLASLKTILWAIENGKKLERSKKIEDALISDGYLAADALPPVRFRTSKKESVA